MAEPDRRPKQRHPLEVLEPEIAFLSVSLDDLVLASFTTGPGATTLPIRIYSEIRLGVKPEINAVCTIVIAFVSAVIVAASLLAKLHDVRRLTARN